MFLGAPKQWKTSVCTAEMVITMDTYFTVSSR